MRLTGAVVDKNTEHIEVCRIRRMDDLHSRTNLNRGKVRGEAEADRGLEPRRGVQMEIEARTRHKARGPGNRFKTEARRGSIGCRSRSKAEAPINLPRDCLELRQMPRGLHHCHLAFVPYVVSNCIKLC
jgi:hypothetical protein